MAAQVPIARSETLNGFDVCLTFNLDAAPRRPSPMRPDAPAGSFRRKRDSRDPVARLLATLAAHRSTATFFVSANEALRSLGTVREIVACGHEIGLRSDARTPLRALRRDQERNLHHRSLGVVGGIIGRAPRGFRARDWSLSAYTLEILEELGFTYDSSHVGTDYVPYAARRTDGESEEVDSSVVEMAVAWESSGAPSVGVGPWGKRTGLALDDIQAVWMAEFCYAYAHVPGGVFTLGLDPETIGRGPQVEALDRLLSTMALLADVRCVSLGAVAAEFFRAPRLCPAVGTVAAR